MPAVLLGAALIACTGSDDGHDHPGGPDDGGSLPAPLECNVEAPTSCPDPAPHYADVEPIFEQRCVICHVGAANSPWPLTSYSHVADWHREIRGAVLNCVMPPPDAGVPITNDERTQILTWLHCGHPE